jgi:hypothetical protein
MSRHDCTDRGLAACLLLATLWPACGRGVEVLSARPAARDPERLLQVLDEMDARRSGVESVVARLNVTLLDKQHEREIKLNGTYLGDRSGNLRLRLKYEEILILDVAICEDAMSVWLPRKNRFYRGTRQQMLALGGNELALLAQAGNACDLFFPRAWTEHAVERRLHLENGQSIITVLEKPDQVRRVLRLFLSSSQPAAEGVEVLGREGHLLGAIRYADYRLAEQPAAKPTATMRLPFPGRLTLDSPSGNRTLQMDVEEFRLNLPLSAAKFAVEVPAGQKVLDLGETFAAGKGLWD